MGSLLNWSDWHPTIDRMDVGGKMKLRKINLDDAELIYCELGCNPAMLKYTGWNPYKTLESTKEFIANAAKSEDSYSWVIEDNGGAIGTIGAYDYNADDQSIEIGYSIFEAYWNKGYATNAVELACEQLKSTGQFKSIKAWCAEENIASAKALERNGFTRTDVVEHAVNVDGKSYNQIIFRKRAQRSGSISVYIEEWI